MTLRPIVAGRRQKARAVQPQCEHKPPEPQKVCSVVETAELKEDVFVRTALKAVPAIPQSWATGASGVELIIID